jgi:HAMP domain-containing protein
MKWLAGFLAGVVLPLLLSEFTDWCPWFAKRLVQRAVRRLPEGARALGGGVVKPH